MKAGAAPECPKPLALLTVSAVQASDPALRSLSRSPPFSEGSERMMEIHNMRRANSRSPTNIRSGPLTWLPEPSIPSQSWGTPYACNVEM